MSLAQRDWTAVSIHKVVLAWLRAEREKLAAQFSELPADLWMHGLAKVIDKADLDSPIENRARLRLLYFARSLFFFEIPPDTAWYEITHLSDGDLAELHVVRHGNWTDAADKNELVKVAARKNFTLRTPPADWATPILWGHDRTGPFTILEGNHRLVAYAASGRSDLDISVLVGLSPTACIWHILDDCSLLFQDLLTGQTYGATADDLPHGTTVEP